MVQNALLAVASGRASSFPGRMRRRPGRRSNSEGAMQVKEIHGVQFLDDSYNANPDSMKAALRTLVELDADGRPYRRVGRDA